jgi:hypothetical protein
MESDSGKVKKVNEWFIDCFIVDDPNFPVNSYGPDDIETIVKVAKAVLLNPESGIEKVTISKETLGCAPMKVK